MPPIADPHLRQELLLHVALYAAAYESRIDRHARYVMIEPATEINPPSLAVSKREFRLRLLAELASWDVPVAFAPAAEGSGPEAGFFPGTREPATRLRIAILQRIEDQATVIA